MNVFYVYGHFTKNTNELFYIGKGKGNRAYECNTSESRKKMSEIKRGKKRKPFSQEHKRKISEAQKNRHAKKHLINS